MGDWAAGTVLPSLLGFDATRLTSQTSWYVTDDLINEKELQERREKDPDLDDTLFAGLDDKAFRTIEDEVAARVLEPEEPSPATNTTWVAGFSTPNVARISKMPTKLPDPSGARATSSPKCARVPHSQNEHDEPQSRRSCSAKRVSKGMTRR